MDLLKAKGQPVYNKADLLHYKGESVGAAIKAILARAAPTFRMGLPATETLLICAKRAYEWQTAVQPMLDQGAVVLCDRDIDTVCAYQLEVLAGDRQALSYRKIISLLRNINGVACMNPGLTFGFHVSVEESYRRFLRRECKTEREWPRRTFAEEQERHRSSLRRVFNVPMPGRRLVEIDTTELTTDAMCDRVWRDLAAWLRLRT